MSSKYLEQINSPADLKKLQVAELAGLAEEIRQFILSSVSKTGGHLSSNLGAVELTLALHYVFDFSQDKLLWDVGQVPDADIPDDGTEVAHGILKATRRLSTQLAALGYQTRDIGFLAMSHYHADHTANANRYAGSTWIVQQAEYDAMFSTAQLGIRTPESYKDLQGARRITLNGGDHDVFGDGTVVIKSAPGHTPGHQMLFLKLRHFGPLLLMGDLYHLPEERSLDRVPTFDFDAAVTRATRKQVEAFVHKARAKAWIQHDPATYGPLKKAPAFYD